MESCLGGILLVYVYSLQSLHIPLESIYRVTADGPDVTCWAFSLPHHSQQITEAGMAGKGMLCCSGTAGRQPQLCPCMLHDRQASEPGDLCG